MLSTWTRFGIVLIAALATLASAGKSKSRTVGTGQVSAPPPPMAMSPDTALGLWKSSFGAVKIERDDAAAGTTSVMGVWVYQRGAEEVVGFFKGALNGNVLEFSWQEPGIPSPLVGSGYLVFDPGGARFNGKWWTSSKDRQGDWTGWRQAPAATTDTYHFEDDQLDGDVTEPTTYGGSGYGGTTYGGTVYGGDGPTSPPPPPPNGAGPQPGPM